MPSSAKAKRQPSEASPQGLSGAQLCSQPLKQSRKRSRKIKARKAAKKKKNMNLPTRLARLLKCRTKNTQIEGLKSMKLEQKLHGVCKATAQYQRNGTLTAVAGSGSGINEIKRDNNNGCLSASASYVYKSHNSSHQRTFAQGIVSNSNANSEYDSKGRDSDLKDGDSNAGKHRLIPKEKIIALDCEMVGVGPEGRISALARCSIVDYDCNVLYDAYIKPELEILDYRTPWSGIRKHHMKGATPFQEAQQQITNILRGKILVDHSLRFDIQVLKLGHPRDDIRDTSMYRGLRELAGMTIASGQHPGLKKLTKQLFGHSIQEGEHCSVEDAKATMNLYKLVEKQWEGERVSTFPDQDFRVSFMDDHFWPDDLDQ